MYFTLYRIPQLRANKQNTLSFEFPSDKASFFSQITQKLTVSTNDSTVGRITDPGKLYQQVTVFTNGDNPYSVYNYASITFTSGKQYFYFVTDFKEIGQSQVIYYLKKDTIVTYVDLNGSSGVNLYQHKALVTREHKQRFNFAANKALYHRIPEPGDNTTPVVLTENVMQASQNVRARLVYKNRTDSKPVAYPYVETPLSVAVVGSDWIGTVYSQLQDINTTETMYMWDGNFEYTLGEGVPNIPISVPSTQYVKYIRSGTGNRTLSTYRKSDGTVVNTNILTVPSGRDLKIRVGNQSTQLLLTAGEYVPPGRSWDYITTNYTPINYEASTTKPLPLWTEIDQYDAMTDRIIEVPYFNKTNKTFYEDGYGIFIPLETENNTLTNYQFKYRPTGTFDMTKVDKLRIKYNDPKLYTSQFAPVLLNMNGMAIGLKREAYDPENGLLAIMNTGITFNYQILTPSTFNLKINITEPYIKEDVDELKQTWQVNNEIATIKDDAYTYNQYYKDLDDKQRRVQESAAYRNTALNSVNQALGVTGGMIAGGKPNPVQLVTRAGQAGINIAQSWMDLSDQMKLNDIAAKQKYIGLLLSASQISGGTLNFVKSFNGDKIREVQFGLTGNDLDYWDEVFHKFGYTTLEYKIPNLKTRKYWDYKQMVIDEIASAYVTDECLDDIKARFAEGVTIYHYQSGANPSTIDWGQTKENWEV